MTAIDLSKIPPPTLVPVDHDANLAVRLASVQARYEAAGLPWDVGGMQMDPAVIQQQEDAFRQMLDKQAINDMALARTIGFARGADLDWIAATLYAELGLTRLEGELDERFERRILLAGEALSGALTRGGIIYHAMTTDLRVIDAVAYKVAAGMVEAYILVETDAEQDVLEAVRIRLREPKLRGSEVVTVGLAKRRAEAVRIRLQHGTGPSPILLEAEANTMLATITERAASLLGTRVTTDELIAVGRVGGVSKLILDAPTADLDPGRNGVLDLSIQVTTELMF